MVNVFVARLHPSKDAGRLNWSEGGKYNEDRVEHGGKSRILKGIIACSGLCARLGRRDE